MDKYRTFRRYRHGAGLLSGYIKLSPNVVLPLSNIRRRFVYYLFLLVQYVFLIDN